jgi:hypothetical protein
MLELEKEKAYEYHFIDHLGFVTVRCPARLALQPKLGLWRQWDRWDSCPAGNPWSAVQLVLMNSRQWILVLVCAGLALAACGTNQSDVQVTPANPVLEEAIPPDVALNVQNQISEALGVPVESLQLQNIEKTDWPNSCLGLPSQGDEVCAEVITPGWLLTFNINNQEYQYRVDSTGTVVRQEP